MEKKEPTDDTSLHVYSQQFNSTCFGHHYAHRQEKRLYKTACSVSLDVLTTVVWSRDTTPHNRSQHIQANTTRGHNDARSMLS